MAMEWLLESGRFTMKPGMKKASIDLFMAWLKRNMLLVITFSGVVTGVVCGLGLRHYEPSQFIINIVAYPGELFMRLLKLMILPLVIASLITGSASLNAKMNGMIALRTILFFILTSLLSAVVGLCLVVIAHPGDPNTRPDINTTTTNILADKKGDIMDNFLSEPGLRGPVGPMGPAGDTGK